MRELFREFRAARERLQDEYDQLITQAWWVANLNNAKKLPDLKTLLSKRATKQTLPDGRQTLPQMRSMVVLIADAYGLKMRQRARNKTA